MAENTVIVEFTIYGNPVAQGRPRFARIGNNVRAYDPGKSRGWKDDVRLQALQHRPKELIAGAISLHLMFHLPRPKSLPKRVTEHTKKPDAENLSKAVCDALEGLLYHNDSQIVRLTVEKQYAGSNGPMVRVTLITAGGQS